MQENEISYEEGRKCRRSFALTLDTWKMMQDKSLFAREILTIKDVWK